MLIGGWLLIRVGRQEGVRAGTRNTADGLSRRYMELDSLSPATLSIRTERDLLPAPAIQ